MGAGNYVPTQTEWARSFISQTIMIQSSVKLTDVSFWQSEIDFVKMKSAGIKGTIIRAGQNNWLDSRFAENWSKAKAAGLPRGSYWFYDSRNSPKSQAELWWSLIKNDKGELFHVADFEENYGGGFGTKAHFREFIVEFQKLSGLPNKRIGIYTGYYWWGSRIGNDPWFSQYPLWLAWYSAMENVKVPAPWTELALWQYSDRGDGKAHGVSSESIDLNWWRGNEADFNNYFGLNETQPPDGGTSMEYDVTIIWDNGASVRHNPNTGGNPITVFAKGTKFKASEIVQDSVFPTNPSRLWARVKGGLYNGKYVAVVYDTPRATYVLVEEPPTVTRTHVIEVFSDGSIKVDGIPI